MVVEMLQITAEQAQRQLFVSLFHVPDGSAY